MRKILFEKTYINCGLLIARLGLGISFFHHGLPKLSGGPEKWVKLGGQMSHVGINFLPEFWGFMAAYSECIGGLLIAAGFLFRINTFLLAFTMFVALFMHLSDGDPFGDYSHSMEAMFVFIALLFTGPGKYAVDQLLFKNKMGKI